MIAVPLFVRGLSPSPQLRTRRVLGLIGMVVMPLQGILDEVTGSMVFRALNDIGVAALLSAAG